jgi:L-galactose dehydrogenase/L-glyceraldehyde 3-phosphate reductase
MTKGDPEDQDRAIVWARDNGINHFDTAPLYGNGASENNLGRALGSNRDGIVVSTKVRLLAADLANVETAIRSSIETSLQRLKQDHVDLFQLHNTISSSGEGEALTVDQVLNEVVPVFEALRKEGKTRSIGFTANGDTDALHELVRSGCFDAAQVFYNLLTPSAGEATPVGYPGQDYRQLLDIAQDNAVGTIGVRVLAGGALSGHEKRHPLGMQIVGPIGSGRDYATDAARARQFEPLLDEAEAKSLPELAIRYVIANRALSTTEIGIATLEELQKATAAINNGPLTPEVLAKIDQIRADFRD